MEGLVGVWKLMEARAFDDADQEVPSPLGPNPMGVAIFGAERGRAMAGDGRAALLPEAKRAFAAYCGRYTFDGTKLVTRVDGASSPDMVGGPSPLHPPDGPRRMVYRLFDRGSGLGMVWERVG